MNLSKRTIAVGLAVLLVGLFGIVAASEGIGEDSVSDDAVAEVDGEAITEEDFNRALQQAALRQGLQEAPAADSEQYELIRNEALGDLFDIAWIQNEAEERGVEVSDRQIQDQLAQIRQQNFPTEKKYQAFLEQSGFTQEDVNLRVELQLLSQAIQEEVVGTEPPKVSDSEIEEFYDQNKEQFEQPEQRDIRLILNKDQAKVEEAKKLLEADPSDANWNKVAAKFSTDQSSKDSGGERTAITPGVLEGELDQAVFNAPVNTIQGPVETPLGFYIFEVTKETPAGQQSLDQVRDQLQQQLGGQKQQEEFTAFIEDYRTKWTELTVCAEGFEFERCDNFTAAPAAECTEEQASQTGCPPPVIGRNPVAPGQGSSLLGASGGAPQRPHPPGEGAAAPTGIPGGVPGGAVPTAPTG